MMTIEEKRALVAADESRTLELKKTTGELKDETFRVHRDNETRQYGEYRTRRLLLDAWLRFNFHD